MLINGDGSKYDQAKETTDGDREKKKLQRTAKTTFKEITSHEILKEPMKSKAISSITFNSSCLLYYIHT